MGDFLSRSAELLRTHPHLLDGGLSRALLYAALALILGTRLWLHFRPRLALRRHWLTGRRGRGSPWASRLLLPPPQVAMPPPPCPTLGG